MKGKKILFIARDIGVKQYHLACAFRNFEHTTIFAPIYPSGLNWIKFMQGFPHPRKMLRGLLKMRSYHSRIDPTFGSSKNPKHPFSLVFDCYIPKILDIIKPDIIYLSASAFEKVNTRNYPLIVDVEDSVIPTIIDTKSSIDQNDPLLKKEKEFIYNKNNRLILFGSQEELKLANFIYLDLKTPTQLIYPLVSSSTLPNEFNEKHEDFDMVYIGSIWKGGHRDCYEPIKQVLDNDFPVTVYLLNSNNKPNYKRLKKLEENYSNFTLNKFIGYGNIKKEISGYHVGLVYRPEFTKTKATYGMKPLEYAYANVQPVVLGEKYPVINLNSPNEEFGYYSTPDTIKEDYVDNLKNFDYNYHLMERQLPRILKKLFL